MLLACTAAALRQDFDALCADRMAIERVYQSHRTGTKGPIEEVLPRSLIEKMVREELKKEAALKKVYRVEITPEQVDGEVKRINETTRAPEVLEELKQALGNDPARFARTVAKPLVVDRELRARFANDDHLHLAGRRAMEKVRTELIAAKQTNAPLDKMISIMKTNRAGTFNETTWELGTKAETKKDGTDSGELKPPGTEKFKFEDLSPQLQEVLRAQLKAPRDVSAVIETSTGFLLFVAKEKTDELLSAAVLSIPKTSFDEWLQSLKGI